MPDHDVEACYAALRSKDARYDGRFFVGVSSTGIYCRPLCRARPPKAEHCTFYATAAAAEQAGYRPCRLCRPELAPGTAPLDAASLLAHQAAGYLQDHCASVAGLEGFPRPFGCTEHDLQQAFARQHHVSPAQYLQTCRLLLAKSLLTDTDLALPEVALAAGLASAGQLSDLFQAQYRLAPASLRRQAKANGQGGPITLALGYRPPYHWQQMLHFFAPRAIPGVETVRDGAYLRTVHLVTDDQRHVYGWLRVGQQAQKDRLTVTVAAALLPVLPQVLGKVRRLFDLSCDPHAVYEGLFAMNTIRPGLCVLGTRRPGCFDAFEMAVRAVLGQQITVKAATTLAGRFAEAYGTPIATGIEGLSRAFPTPAAILALDGPIADHLGRLGIIAARSRTILELARTMAQATVTFDYCTQPETESKRLLALPGIGDWTAQYIAMRAMAWADAFPSTDYGVKKALAPRTGREIVALAESWRPWRSYATVNLWRSLQQP